METKFSVEETLETKRLKREEMPEYLDSDDPIILKTSWKPLKGGGQSYKSHNLVKVNDNRLEFKMALSAFIFYAFIILVGLAIMILPFVPGVEVEGNVFIAIGVGAFVAGVGSVLYYFGNKKIVLDKNLMAMWRGKVDAAKMINPQDVEGYFSLKKVHAVQLIKEYIRDIDHNGHSYYSHELNLIFDDGKRVNIVDHAKNHVVTQQAEIVSEFLNIPLWDGRFDGVDSATAKAHNILYKLFQSFKFFKFIVFLIIAISVLYMFFRDDPNSKINLSTLSGPQQEKVALEYTQEMFELVKSNKVNLPYLNKLLDTGIYIDAVDDLGRTALFYAVQTKNRDNINLFLRRGANIHIKDHSGIGLKELLDSKKDRNLYYMIIDHELEDEASKEGKIIYGINRSFDKEGNLVKEEILKR